MSSSIRMAGKQYQKHTHTVVYTQQLRTNQTKYITMSFMINYFFFYELFSARATNMFTGCDGNANRSAHRTDSTGGLVRDRISFCLDAVDDKRARGAPVVRSCGRHGGERGWREYDKYVWPEPVWDCFILGRKVRDRLEVLRTRQVGENKFTTTKVVLTKKIYLIIFIFNSIYSQKQHWTVRQVF